MKHTLKQIFSNQEKFGSEIKKWLKDDFKTCKKSLKDIDPGEDKDVKKAKEKLRRKLKKIKIDKVIQSLFFISGRTRRASYYAWWNEEDEEVTIHSYDKKELKSISRLGVRR